MQPPWLPPVWGREGLKISEKSLPGERGGGQKFRNFYLGEGGILFEGGVILCGVRGGGHIILKKKSKLRNTSIKSIFGITKLIS